MVPNPNGAIGKIRVMTLITVTEGVTDSRNFSPRIGLVVKRGGAANSRRGRQYQRRRGAEGVNLSFVNFQNQTIKTLVTDGDGFAEAELEETPFYVEAEKDGQKGILNLPPYLFADKPFRRKRRENTRRHKRLYTENAASGVRATIYI